MFNYKKTAMESSENIIEKQLPIPLSNNLLFILSELKKQNKMALIVGGAVRDSLLGAASKDVDIEVYGVDYNELFEIMKNISGKLENNRSVVKTHVDIVGNAFGVLKFYIENFHGHKEDFDFSIPRRENKSGGGHKAFDIKVDSTMTPKDAASRRDFSINAMAYDPLTYQLHDYYGGLQDIENKILRATSSAFAEDPLRVLRGMQFAARFDFTLDEKTAEVCKEVLHDVYEINNKNITMKKYEELIPIFLEDGSINQKVPAFVKNNISKIVNGKLSDMEIKSFIQIYNKNQEKLEDGVLIKEISLSDKTVTYLKPLIPMSRISEEWMKLLTKGKYPGSLLKFLMDSGWIEIYPEIKNIISDLPGEEWVGKGVPQDPEWHPEGNLEKHITQALNNAALIADREKLTKEERAVLILSSLCHDFGKAITTKKEMKNGAERITSNGHDVSGIDFTKTFLKRIGVTKEIAEQIVPLVQYHMVHIDQYKENSKNWNVLQLAEKIKPANIKLLTMLIEVDHSSRIADNNSVYPSQNTGIPDKAKIMMDNAIKNNVFYEPLKPFLQNKAGELLPLIHNHKHNKFLGTVQNEVKQQQLMGNLKNETEIWNYAKTKLVDLIVSDIIDTKTDIIDRLNIDPKTQGPMISEIKMNLKLAYLNGEIKNREDSLKWIDKNYNINIDIEAGEENKMLKFSKHNMNFDKEQPDIIEIIYKEFCSDSPNWNKIRHFLQDDEFLKELMSFYHADNNFAKETYEELLNEFHNEEIAAHSNKVIKKAEVFNQAPVIDLNDPFNELRSYVSSDVIDRAITYIQRVEGDIITGIAHVGVLFDSGKLGMFQTHYDNMVKEEVSKQQGLNQNDLNNIKNDRKGVSILVNPQRIKMESNKLLGQSYDEDDHKEVFAIVLAEVICHEITHATGGKSNNPANDESQPVNFERNFLHEIIKIVNNERSQIGKSPLNIAVKNN
jgi:tRNA nucleotidyltransferase/poly(A) polymerase